MATMGATRVARQAGKKQASAVIPATITVEYRNGPAASMRIPAISDLE